MEISLIRISMSSLLQMQGKADNLLVTPANGLIILFIDFITPMWDARFFCN